MSSRAASRAEDENHACCIGIGPDPEHGTFIQADRKTKIDDENYTIPTQKPYHYGKFGREGVLK